MCITAGTGSPLFSVFGSFPSRLSKQEAKESRLKSAFVSSDKQHVDPLVQRPLILRVTCDHYNNQNRYIEIWWSVCCITRLD